MAPESITFIVALKLFEISAAEEELNVWFR